MSVRSFFDTNVLVYADDKASRAKQRRAIELVTQHRRGRSGVVSLQVLQQYFVTVTRKLGLDPSVARCKVELLAEFDVVAPDVSDILAAIDLHRLQQISRWDPLVVRAAGQAGCVVLFSEDMQTGATSMGLESLTRSNDARVPNNKRLRAPRVHRLALARRLP